MIFTVYPNFIANEENSQNTHKQESLWHNEIYIITIQEEQKINPNRG